MEKELWDRAQQFVSSGLGHLVKDIYIKELERQLTPEQLERIGGASFAIEGLSSDTPDDMQKMIHDLVYFVRKGIMVGPRPRPE